MVWTHVWNRDKVSGNTRSINDFIKSNSFYMAKEVTYEQNLQLNSTYKPKQDYSKSMKQKACGLIL